MTAKFAWKPYATEAEEQQQKQQYTTHIHDEEEGELYDLASTLERSAALQDHVSNLFAAGKAEESDPDEEFDEFSAMLQQDPTINEHLSLLSRKYDTKRQLLEEDPLLYRDDVFVVEPQQGEIWPNSVRAEAAPELYTDFGNCRRSRFPSLSSRRTRSLMLVACSVTSLVERHACP